MSRKQLVELLKASASKWSNHDAPRMGAAIAYYSLLSMAPLAILMVRIAGAVLHNSAERDVLRQVDAMAGYATSRTLETLIQNTHTAGGGLTATVLAIVTLLFGASGVFVELRDSLNAIWDAPPQPSSGLRSIIFQRLFAFGMIIALGVLLLASVLASAGTTLVEKFFAGILPLPLAVVTEIANFALSLAGITVLFGLIFKFVPDVPIDWQDVWIGAFTTAVLFDIGKILVAVYLGTAAVGSTYGAAGSVVALVVWVYYSAQIFLFGAVFTRLYADRLGSPEAKKKRALLRRRAAVS